MYVVVYGCRRHILQLVTISFLKSWTCGKPSIDLSLRCEVANSSWQIPWILQLVFCHFCFFNGTWNSIHCVRATRGWEILWRWTFSLGTNFGIVLFLFVLLSRQPNWSSLNYSSLYMKLAHTLCMLFFLGINIYYLFNLHPAKRIHFLFVWNILK